MFKWSNTGTWLFFSPIRCLDGSSLIVFLVFTVHSIVYWVILVMIPQSWKDLENCVKL